MRMFFERRTKLAPGIWQYWFAPEHTLDFVPGQYVDVTLPGTMQDPRGGTRTFSLVSLPSNPQLSFITKHFELQSPYKQQLQGLQPHGEATIGDSMGDLVLPKAPDLPLVFVAGGIGIASYASMLRDLLARKEERPVFLFYALRARREQLFRELTSRYPLQLTQVTLAPNRLSAREIKDTTPPEALIYLSGSQSFVEGLQAELEAFGTPRSSIVFDYYDGYAEL